MSKRLKTNDNSGIEGQPPGTEGGDPNHGAPLQQQTPSLTLSVVEIDQANTRHPNSPRMGSDSQPEKLRILAPCFLLVALIANCFSFGEVPGVVGTGAEIIFFASIVIFIVMMIINLRRKRMPPH